MPDGADLNRADEALTASVDRWLAAFDRALAASDMTALAALIHPDGHWRDLVALTWNIGTVSGGREIAAALVRFAADAKPSSFRTDGTRTPPRRVSRAGTEAIEAFFSFSTAAGRGTGVLRLVPDAADGDTPKAWTLLTALDEIAGHEETIGAARPSGEVYSRDFSGPNWLDRRNAAAAFDDREPDVLVVGGGQAGLSIAARLTQLGVDTLVVDREDRIGDNWRKRYHALTLHNQVHVNHLPYLPYPPNWPKYLPKDKIAGWFEAYAGIMEINFWTGTGLAAGHYDEAAGRWSVTLTRSGGATRELHPRHLVMATGASGIPNIPRIPTLDSFAGEIIHSGAYTSAAGREGSRVVIIGTGTSAHDIAQDLHSHGAGQVTLVQRSPTTVVNVEPSAQLPYALYDEGPPLDDCDLLAASLPYGPLRKAHQLLTERAAEIDRPLLDGLRRAGFRIDEEDTTGWQFKYLQRGGGYYFNVGCSDLIVDGKIGLVQYDDIDTFNADGVTLTDGRKLPADLVVLATGFKGQAALVEKLFGEDVARRVGPIWGFDEESQELRNMWVRTGQPGLWFIAGSFAQCRIYSKYLGLQIKACIEGMIPAAAPAD